MECRKEVLEDIGQHGADTYPEECCGFLLGVSSQLGNVVTEIYRVENRDNGERRRRYTITARDYMLADRAAGTMGCDIVGIYHSHPDHPARPSATDLAEATFPGFTYAIVSVQGGSPEDITAWGLAADRSHFEAESVQALPESAKKIKY